MSVTANKLSH